jgi:hypothetical protein
MEAIGDLLVKSVVLIAYGGAICLAWAALEMVWSRYGAR